LLNFSYVCPEPVLVKSIVFSIKRLKKTVFAHLKLKKMWQCVNHSDKD